MPKNEQGLIQLPRLNQTLLARHQVPPSAVAVQSTTTSREATTDRRAHDGTRHISSGCCKNATTGPSNLKPVEWINAFDRERGNEGVGGTRVSGEPDVPGTMRSGNEGVGERGRRRTRQDQISRKALGPGETADHAIRTERRNLVSSAGKISRSELLETTTRPFDLMSRRHPLSSTRAFRSEPASRSRSS